MSDAGSISLRNQATLSFAGTMVDAAVSFLGLVAFAYVLGAAGLGRFYLVLAAVQVAEFPVRGVGQAVMKRASERSNCPAACLGGGVVLAGAYALAVVGLVVAVTTTAPDVIPGGPELVPAAVAVFVGRAGFLLLVDAYRGYGATGLASLWDNTLGIAETLLQVALLAAGLRVVGLLTGTALATVVVGVALVLTTRVSIGMPTRPTLASLVGFARWSTFASGTGALYSRVPVLLLGVLATETAVGFYTSANRLLMLGSFVGGSVAPALMVKTSATGDDVSDLRFAVQYVSLLSIPLAFGSFAMPDALMTTFFGPAFETAGLALVGLSLYHLLNPLSTVADSFLDGIDRPDVVTGAKTVALVVRATLAVGLGLQFGLPGVIAAVVVSHAAHVGLTVLAIRRETGALVTPTRAWRQVASGALMYAVVAGAKMVIAPASWVHVGALVGLGGITYVAALWQFDDRFQELLVGVLRDGAARFPAG